ncbi:hypothetical protein G9A89_011442 [Geosiphon pyriformis]|nr:hypothetical protein G9A89_011442 [Geosiphon pyriformis]
MFESIVTEYLKNIECRDWTIISILEHTKSKCRLHVDSIDVLKDDIYTSLRRYKKNSDNNINVTNKLSKCLSTFERSFSAVEVKEFIHKLREEQEECGFDTNGYRTNQTVIDEYKKGEPSCSEVASRKNKVETKSSSEEETEFDYEETDLDYNEKPNKMKKRSKNDIEMRNNDDGSKTPPSRSQNTVMTTPQKPILSANSIKYLDKHFSIDINQQCVIMKEIKINIIPGSVRDWLYTVLSSGKDVFKNVVMVPLIPDHQFRKICEIILYDFFSMASDGPLNRHIGERKYTVERIVPLFKAIQSIYKEYIFNWIEVQLDCIKEVKMLFPEFDLTLNKADGVLKVSNNKEIVFIEVSGGPESTVPKHVKEDSEKLIKEAMFGLVSLLRDYLDKNPENVKNICTYMVQIIGDRMTLSKIQLVKKHFYIISQIKSAILPFSFNEIEKFLEIFELLYALISGLEGQINELKKLAFTNSTDGVPTVRDWIWVPESMAEWESIEIRENNVEQSKAPGTLGNGIARSTLIP